MKKKIADLWIEALESGKYKQTKGQLRRQKPDGKSYGYCCLGVLCDLYRKETGSGEWKDCSLFFGALGELPHEVMQWGGIKDSSGLLKNTIQAPLLDNKGESCGIVCSNSLIDLNDEAGYSFKKIAKVIKKSYKDL